MFRSVSLAIAVLATVVSANEFLPVSFLSNNANLAFNSTLGCTGCIRSGNVFCLLNNQAECVQNSNKTRLQELAGINY